MRQPLIKSNYHYAALSGCHIKIPPKLYAYILMQATDYGLELSPNATRKNYTNPEAKNVSAVGSLGKSVFFIPRALDYVPTGHIFCLGNIKTTYMMQ